MTKHPWRRFFRTVIRTSKFRKLWHSLRFSVRGILYPCPGVSSHIQRTVLETRQWIDLIWFDLIWYAVFLSCAPDGSVLGKESVSPLDFLTESRGQFSDNHNSFSLGPQFETRFWGKISLEVPLRRCEGILKKQLWYWRLYSACWAGVLCGRCNKFFNCTKGVEFLYWLSGESMNESSDNTDIVSMYCSTRHCAAKYGMGWKFTMKYCESLF
jgi:hypothetical protein